MAEEQRRAENCGKAQYREAVCALQRGDESAKTIIAYYKLTGCGDVRRNQDEAIAMLEERVEKGDGEAMWMLGLCCEYGLGIKQDLQRAEELYQKSSEGGNVVGEFLQKNGKYDMDERDEDEVSDDDERGSGVMKTKGLLHHTAFKHDYLLVDNCSVNRFAQSDAGHA